MTFVLTSGSLQGTSHLVHEFNDVTLLKKDENIISPNKNL
jgi:hypothetical protein